MDRRLSHLHELFWGLSESPHTVKISAAIPDERTLNIEGGPVSVVEAINLPEDTTFPDDNTRILISDIYKIFWNILCNEDENWQGRPDSISPFAFPSHATVISGQSGIGKYTVPFLSSKLNS